MGEKTRISEFQTLKIIMRKYIFRVPQVRVLIFPVILSIFAGKYFEVEVSNCASRISGSLESEDGLKDMIILFLVVSVMDVIFSEVQGIVFASAIQNVYRYTLRNTFNHFIRMETDEFESYGSGTIQSIITRKSKAISEFIEVLIQHLLPVFFILVLVGIKVYMNLGPLAALIIIIAVGLYTFMTVSIALRRNVIKSMLNKAENSSSDIVYDTLNNHESVISFNNHDIEVRRYDEKLVDVERFGIRLSRSLYALNLSQKLVFVLLNSSVIVLGVYGLMSHKMNRESFLFYMTVSRTLRDNLDNLGYMYCKLMEAMLNAREVLSEDHEFQASVGLGMNGFKKSIVFNDVRVCHGEKEILGEVNVNIEKGDNIAVIGANGAGKSTILKSFLRFNCYQGTIYIDDINIKAIENESFRRIVSYIPQNSVLFNDTVMYNIKYGNPGVSDTTVVELAKKFNIHNSIMRLERGYFTNVGELGRHVSGGERQKIVILRALMREPEILVMDEPTSNLDKEAEYDIMRNIIHGLDSLTVIAIVHNLDLLSFFNKICLVDKGTAKIIRNSTPEVSESIVEISLNQENQENQVES